MLNDSRKGMSRLVDALVRVKADMASASGGEAAPLHLAVAGHEPGGLSDALPFPLTCLGMLSDPVTLALAYQAADVYASASLADEGPIMISEAMMCATPAVAFPTNLARDVVQTMTNGYLCSTFESEELAHGLVQVLSSDMRGEMGSAARETALRIHGRAAFLSAFESLCESMVEAKAMCGETDGGTVAV